MNKPLVTVVTVIKDIVKAKRQDFFKQCIESVQAQTYPHIEHLIIDGASQDGTQRLLEKLKKKKNIRVISAPDEGIYYAMNNGIENAKGTYIAFLNSDDYYSDPTCVAQSVECLQKTNADFSFGTVLMTDDKNTNLSFYPFESMFFYTMPFSHQSMFCRTSLLSKFKFDTNFRLAGDFDLIIRLYLSGAVSVEVPCRIATYRMSGLSSQKQDDCYEEYAKVFQKNYSRFKKYSQDIWDLMARQQIIPEELFFIIKNELSQKNPKQAEKIFKNCGISYSEQLKGVKSYIKRFLKAILPKRFLPTLKELYIDYFDKDVYFSEKICFFLNIIPLYKIKRGMNCNVYKFYLFNLLIYKSKLTR